MASVSVSRTVDAGPAAVRDAIEDVGPFMRASGFDAVTLDEDLIHLENEVGVVTIELTVRRVDRPEAAFAYEAVEGPFETMTTRYAVEPGADGTTVRADTSFSLSVAVVGEVMDATLVTHQRRRELEAQLDWLADRVA